MPGHRRLAGAFCLAALLLAVATGPAAAAATAAAPCIEFGSDAEGASDSGCATCAADGSRCEACREAWVLTPAGECLKCNVTTLGPWQDTCGVCKAEDPTSCVKCRDYCNTNGCTGYFVTRSGGCSRCPAGAARCEDLTGQVTECRRGLGLVGGECRPCKIEGCEKCDGDLFFCTQCHTNKAWGKDGLYPDPTTGQCKPCDSGCRTCTGPGTCLECANTVLDPATQKCPPCTVPNCTACRSSLDTCDDDECMPGFWLADDNTCNACTVPNCRTCDDTGRCIRCMAGFGLVLNECKRCAAADSGCLSCDDNPAVCAECLDNQYPDPATGMCGPCRSPNCTLCQYSDATRCDDSGYWCGNGTYLSNTTQTCVPCTAAGCWMCLVETPNKCDSCASNYWRDEATEECKPCADPACDECDISRGAACDRCSEGHYLDSSTKVCKPCSDPEGAKYATCKTAAPPGSA